MIFDIAKIGNKGHFVFPYTPYVITIIVIDLNCHFNFVTIYVWNENGDLRGGGFNLNGTVAFHWIILRWSISNIDHIKYLYDKYLILW